VDVPTRYDGKVLLSSFDFELPEHLIAQAPAAERAGARLLVLERRTGRTEHATTADLPRFLSPGDLLVVNDTRVIPARLHGRRVPSGGAVECLLLRAHGDDTWEALVHPGQKLRPGERMRFERDGVVLLGEILQRFGFGRRIVRLWREHDGAIDEAIEAIGEIPLPPYIKRTPDASDRERYQTVYARERGSVAAPTAGLHLTPATFAALESRGIGRAEITLHVGYGTFEPVRTEQIEQHRIHPEPFSIPEPTSDAIARTRRAGGRIVAVGTTTTRTLEAVAREHGGAVPAVSGEADLFIYPGFEFQVVGALLTNFHLPKSSLLMLVAAFAGKDLVLETYRDAISRGYRFYSYGDAMLIL
jgi:S-adenosylmethionine:tRNA ribosyltransferase-isomerase